MRQANLCYDCDPCPYNRRHVFEKIDLIVFPIYNLFAPIERLLQRFPTFQTVANKAVFGVFFRTLFLLKILREVEARDSDEELYNRSLVVVREARKRGIHIRSIKLLWKSTNHYSIEIHGRKRFFEGLPPLEVEHISPIHFDDKGKLKELLHKEHLPYSRGSIFRDYASALVYVRDTISFPVVVKPRSGSLSKHTTCNIQNEHQLQAAIRVAKVICKEFVVERFIEGDVHRITVVNGEVVASCLREPPNVVGDGKHAIRELIDIKNQDPTRGFRHQKNFTLHHIVASARTDLLLSSQHVSLNSVLPNGKKVYLHDKVILACGADIHDTTDSIHPENKVLFKKVYELCGAPLIGIDFITKDISIPYDRQPCAVIEVNSLPYIDMHHYPVTGKMRNVAGHILDHYISSYQYA